MIKLLTIALAGVLLAIAVSATFGFAEPAFAFVRQVPHSDKAAHFLLLGMMSLLWNLALDCRRIRLGRFSLLKASALLYVIVTIDEFAQIWIVTRSFSWMDLLCNYLGIAVFGRLAIFLSHAARV